MGARGYKIDPQRARRELGITEEQQRLEELVRDVYGHDVVWVPPKRTSRPWRSCDRCGIPTRNRGLCRDCRDLDG